MKKSSPQNPLDRESAGKFFQNILSASPSVPEKDYKLLCDEWLEATRADWIWLWLIDGVTGQEDMMQLVATSHGAPLPNEVRLKKPTSATAYCAKSGKIEIISEFSTWSRVLDGQVYNVKFPEQLTHLGCSVLICTPFSLPQVSTMSGVPVAPVRPAISGAICVHYRRAIAITEQDKDHVRILDMMGRLTARAILNSYQVLQRQILIELNELAHRYLTAGAGGRQPYENCKSYADEVTEVIRKHLHVKGVSIFYRDFLRGGVQLLATTGLMWANGKIIPQKELPYVHYPVGEGNTGICYRDGQPIVLEEGLDERDHPHTVELIDGKPERRLPAVIYPIPLATGANKALPEPQALGVIRCKYHYSALIQPAGHPAGLCFDAIEMQTLDFIARQIAPILETMEVNIERERVVSIVKHDVLAPLGMIKHKIFNLRKEETVDGGEFVKVHHYDIHDMGVCTMLALNLVSQLEADPTRIFQETHFELIGIEGRVVAPLKNMLVHHAKEAGNMTIQFENVDLIPDLWLDVNLIQRAFFNLLINAIKYGEKGTEIRVEGRQGLQKGYHVDVVNTGPGVEKGEEDLIFTPGYRSPRVKNLRIGLGLGLPIARICVEQCGGKLYLLKRNNPTVFTVFFPEELQRKHQ